MVRNGEGQSSHVLVFCVNLELSEIISFTLKSPSYVYVHSCIRFTIHNAVKLKCFYKPGISFVDNYLMLKLCLHLKNKLKYIIIIITRKKFLLTKTKRP